MGDPLAGQRAQDPVEEVGRRRPRRRRRRRPRAGPDRAAAGRRRPGPGTGPGPISTPRLSVITSSTSWASSNTTTWWGGSTAPPLARWAPYRWVLTTTTSASAARARASSAKQSRPDGHRKAPGHSRAVVETMAQARKWGSKSSSARSPVAVCCGPVDQPPDLLAEPTQGRSPRLVVPRRARWSGGRRHRVGQPVPGWSESCSPRPPTSATRWRHR